jgi:rod shape-determining protein MreB
MAAAIGADLPIEDPTGSMVVDIGGGTTEVAVISMGGIVVSQSIRTAGDEFDQTILQHVRDAYNLSIGERTAEDIKIKIGRVYETLEDATMTIKGRDSKSGMPRDLVLRSSEIAKVLWRPARQIADEVLSVLENTSPELVSDISENGITLTGGGSQLTGMDQLLTERTGIQCTLADDPSSCVAYGCGKSLAWINHMQEGPINIARKRIMKSNFY